MMRAAEFFAGIGLVRLALEASGWEVVFANDIDPKKESMYKANFSGSEFVLDDIHHLKSCRIPSVDLATASFPCIDLSLAGNRRGLSGTHSSAYWGFHRLIKSLHERRPPALLIENVVGLLSSNRGDDLRELLQSLNVLGYFCDLLVIDAAHFVPQSRPRLFVVGTQLRRTDGLIAPHPARPPQVEEFIARNPRLKWFHAELPPFPSNVPSLSSVLEIVPHFSEKWWDSSRQKHLYSQISDRHRRILRELIRRPERSFCTVYKRVRPSGCRAELRFDGLAGCLRTPRGGSSKQFVIEAGCGEWRIRNMTPREYARLQGVSDTYRITVPENVALLGFGDAVCVPALSWLILNAIDPLFETAPMVTERPLSTYVEV